MTPNDPGPTAVNEGEGVMRRGHEGKVTGSASWEAPIGIETTRHSEIPLALLDTVRPTGKESKMIPFDDCENCVDSPTECAYHQGAHEATAVLIAALGVAVSNPEAFLEWAATLA